MTLTFLDPLAVGGGLVVAPQRDVLDPLLAEFAWLADARFDAPDALTDQIEAAVATHGSPQARNVGPDAFDGTALIGQMALSGGTTEGEWFTDLDFRWTGGLLPHVQLDTPTLPTVAPLQILYVADAEDHAVAWLEPNFLPQADGSVLFFLVAAGAADWRSTVPVGTWDENGIAIDDGRLTITAAGALKLYTDGVEVESDAIGAVTFTEPPDGTPVTAGPDAGVAMPILGFVLLDGIDGDPIISFDAEDPSGWVPVSGSPTTAPTRTAYMGNAPGFSFAEAARFDIPADADTSLVYAFRPLTTADETLFAIRNFAMFEGGPGWVLVNNTGLGGYVLGLADGAGMVVLSLGTLTVADQVVVVAIDRTTDTATAYVNGAETDAQDIAALGAIDAGELTVSLNGWLYSAGQADRLLTPGEIAHLPAALGL